VTAQTLTLVILEEGRKGSSLPPSRILHELIRQGGELVSSGVEQVGERMDRLLQVGVDQLAPIRKVREETEALRARLEELETALSRIEVGGEPTGVEPGARRAATKRKKRSAASKPRRDSASPKPTRGRKNTRSTG
jgi:hypothetical protein